MRPRQPAGPLSFGVRVGIGFARCSATMPTLTPNGGKAMAIDALEELTLALRRFAAERDWEQFHTPKNLAMALMIEAAEIAEHFQWTGAGDAAALSEERRQAVALEIGDTFLYLLRLADRLGIDIAAAARTKMDINAARYPVEKVFGRAVKYTEL